ncbi:alpha/beta fold hydrolase [Kitasatospora sp. NPDC059571]|uniref:alpha/beta fold hydrolase n=1 Tax=Kitasatospora sp. NPDC059571 TaxID=3346871 RepID=UPI0036B7F2DB
MDGQAVAHRASGQHRALEWRRRPDAPSAAVLVLHGGQEHGVHRPGPVNLPGLRMRPFARAVERATAGAGVAVGVVRYRCRGWNGDRADAARDTTAALQDLAEELGPIPTVLIGHSMGGRAALRAAGHPCVTGVVALAPWCPEGEPCDQLEGRRVVVLHGERDKITDPGAAAVFATRARSAGAHTAGYLVARSGHTLLHRAPTWHRTTAELTAGLLGLGRLPAAVSAALALPADDGGGLRLPL